MRTPLRFIPCLALLLVCCHDSAAQPRRRATAARRAATPNAPATTRLARFPWLITTHPFGEDGEATTLVSLQPMPTGAAEGVQSPLNYGVNFTYEGNTPARFKNVTLSFFSRAKSCLFAAEPSIVMNLDGRPLTFPFRPQTKGADGVFWVERDEEGGDCAETVIVYVSPATLAKIAAARSVTGKIDAEAFQLTANNLGGLRALLAQLRLPQLTNAQPARTRARARARR
jgi:hypothetical protein